MNHSHSHDDAKPRILSNPTRPFDPVGAASASEILTRTQGTAFQGPGVRGLEEELGDRRTIAMPILVSALLEQRELVANRHRPSFTMGRELGVKA
ncbi:MAG TPA: hypothetical protein VGV35_01515 [Bryobacteraceae bacterium]|nr:hypothetical protein [Bryobacteraceae bacterium]